MNDSQPQSAQHGSLAGDAGSGKTAKSLPPLMEQLTAGGKKRVAIIDLKLDMELFRSAKAEAKRAGVKDID